MTGSLRAAFDAALAAREEGAIVEILAREGRFVKAGDALVKIDDKRLVAQRTSVAASLAEAQAAAVRAVAEADDADEDLLALEAASKRGSAVSARELRRARTLAKSLRAGVSAAERRSEALNADLEHWDLRIADATLRAPFDGTVVEKHVEVGEWVSPGTDLIRLVSTGELEVWLDVPERFAPDVAGAIDDGQLTIRAGAAGRRVAATESRAVPRVDPRTRTFPLIASIHGQSALGLAPGMSASAWIPVGKLEATLMVPKDALVYRPAGIAVMTVAGPDEGGASMTGTALMVPIELLFETESEVAVKVSDGGLRPGAVVVVEGNERLFPGTPVAASIRPQATDAEEKPKGSGQ